MSISLENLVRDRRSLHRIPELELDLPQTVRYIQDQLENLDLEIIEDASLHGSFLAFLDLGKKDAIAFRADMDALPISEENEHAFVSTHPGRMHACGHDGHMAVLLETVRNLVTMKDRLAHNLVFIFQAGEESPGGARFITESGYLEKLGVQAVFGLHIWPSLEKGKIGLRPGPQMARSSEITIVFEGKSSHVSRLEQGIDAMAAAARVLLELYEMERSFPRDIHRLLYFGKLEAGSARNAVAGSAILEGTLRTFDDSLFDTLQQKIFEICEREEKRSGVRIDVRYSSGYPALVNDGKLAETILESLDAVRLENPDMASEDFSYYLTRFPGVFFFLGAGVDTPLHNSRFNFDEEVLMRGVELFLQLATGFDAEMNLQAGTRI